MFAFSNSMIEQVGGFQVEVYNMEVFGYDASVHVELKIFGEGMFAAEYEISRADGKTKCGACMNQSTKEETFTAIEKAVIQAMGG